MTINWKLATGMVGFSLLPVGLAAQTSIPIHVTKVAISAWEKEPADFGSTDTRTFVVEGHDQKNEYRLTCTEFTDYNKDAVITNMVRCFKPKISKSYTVCKEKDFDDSVAFRDCSQPDSGDPRMQTNGVYRISLQKERK
jgi:hypothetical protein